MTFDTSFLFAAALLWGVAALALTAFAVHRLGQARSIVRDAKAVQLVAERSPARPVLVMRDGSIDIDDRLAAKLKLHAMPSSIEELADRIDFSGEDRQRLLDSVERARRSGETIHLVLLSETRDRAFEVTGAMAPDSLERGALLLWFADVTESENRRRATARRLANTENALDSLTHLIESAPFPMWYRGPDLNLGLVNSAFVAAVEAANAADVIERGAELIDGSGESGATAGAARALAIGQAHSRTLPATIGGERRMLRIVDVPLPTGAVAGFAIDIQELEDLRYELQQNVQSQRELADRMAAGAAQFEADGRLGFYNQAFVSMSDLDPTELDEAIPFDRVLDSMRERGRVPEVRDYPSWKAERGRWFNAAEELIEEDWILPGGDHWRVAGQPLPDGGLRLILEDRTEQVRLASARDTLLRVRAATFDNLFEVISVFAADGRLYLWNRRFSDLWEMEETWLSEHPRIDELVPAMAQRLVNPTEAAQVRELVRATTSGRKAGSGQLGMTDGRTFDYATVPLPDGNVLVTMTDTTASNRIEVALRERATALEEADAVKTDFVANMSYELRTPLTSIGGFGEMLAAGYAGELSEAAKEYVDAILQSVERLSRMVDRVLDLTRSAGSNLVLEQERVDLAGLCREIAGRYENRVRERRQDMKVEIDASTGTVIGDARRLREAIENVLQNAINYAGMRASLSIRAAGDSEVARVMITDDGPGIPVEEQENVFDRFHRVEAGEKGEASLGLGLPLSRQFIEAHGGSVDLSSEPGKGTRVLIVIPRKSIT